MLCKGAVIPNGPGGEGGKEGATVLPFLSESVATVFSKGPAMLPFFERGVVRRPLLRRSAGIGWRRL